MAQLVQARPFSAVISVIKGRSCCVVYSLRSWHNCSLVARQLIQDLRSHWPMILILYVTLGETCSCPILQSLSLLLILAAGNQVLLSSPRDIITDMGSLFTLDLWRNITEKLGIKRRIRMAFHPRIDEQTKQTNGILEQYLQAYVNYQQEYWNELLHMVEFAYKNRYQETIKRTLFYANYRVNPEHPLITHLMTEKIISATGMKELHDTLQAEMATAQLRHKESYDQNSEPDLKLKSGDMVWLVPCNIHTTRPSKKLDWKK